MRPQALGSSRANFMPFFLMDWLEDLGVKELDSDIVKEAKFDSKAFSKKERNRKNNTLTTKPPLGISNNRNGVNMRFSSVEEAISAAHLLNEEGAKKTKQGIYMGALRCHKKALFICKTLYEENHPDVADALTNIGIVLGKLNRIEEARNHFLLAYQARRDLYGVLHLDTAISAQHLGKVLHKAGQADQSIARYMESTEIKRAVLGKNHPSVALSFASLGGVFRSCRRYQEAQDAYREALKIFRNCELDDGHPAVQKIRTRLDDTEEKVQPLADTNDTQKGVGSRAGSNPKLIPQ